MCSAVWFVPLQVAFETAQPLLLLSPGVVVLATLVLSEHPIMGCAVCGVAHAVCGSVIIPCGVGL